MAIIYTNQSSGRLRKRKKATKRLVQARSEHQAFLLSLGCFKTNLRPVVSFPDLSVKQVSPTSDNLHTYGGFKRSVDDYKWRRDMGETKQTIEAIERKKKQIIIPYNKGPTMLLNRCDDLTSIGKKV